jgi:hypothetical protein
MSSLINPFAKLPNLHVLPAGFRPAGPAEILASAKMQQLVTDLAKGVRPHHRRYTAHSSFCRCSGASLHVRME